MTKYEVKRRALLLGGGGGGGGGGGDPPVGGDLSGVASAATVTGIQGTPVSVSAPASGDTLVYDPSTGSYVPSKDTKYFVSGAAAQAAAPHINGTFVIIDPGSPTSQAGTYQVTTNQGYSFPGDYTKVSDRTDTASEVGVTDAHDHFDSTDVEGVLDELAEGHVKNASTVLAIGANYVATLPAASTDVADFAIELRNGVLLYKSIVSIVSDGGTVSVMEHSVVPGPTVTLVPVTFDADINTGNIRLIANATATGWSCTVRKLVVQEI